MTAPMLWKKEMKGFRLSFVLEGVLGCALTQSECCCDAAAELPASFHMLSELCFVAHAICIKGRSPTYLRPHRPRVDTLLDSLRYLTATSTAAIDHDSQSLS